jgi:Zn-dependent M28 family amino/carboxypeptidase
MLNLDMVGRMKDNSLIAFGTGTAKEWDKILKSQCDSLSLKCQGNGDGYGPSDHMPFYIAKTPVLHFFTGPHEDYHRRTDTVDKLNITGGIQVAELVAHIAREVAKKPVTYVQQKASTTMGQIRSRGDRKGKGAYLGTIPDYSQMAVVMLLLALRDLKPQRPLLKECA